MSYEFLGKGLYHYKYSLTLHIFKISRGDLIRDTSKNNINIFNYNLESD